MGLAYCSQCKWRGKTYLSPDKFYMEINWEWCEKRNPFTDTAEQPYVTKLEKNSNGQCLDFEADDFNIPGKIILSPPDISWWKRWFCK